MKGQNRNLETTCGGTAGIGNNHLMARAMKEKKNVCDLLKQDAQWEKMTSRQKLISVWFGLSSVVLGISGGSILFTLIAVANFAAAAYHVVKYVPMDDE